MSGQQGGRAATVALVVSAIAVLVAAGQGWISYQALRESRQEALMVLRIEACAEIDEAVFPILRGTLVENADAHSEGLVDETSQAWQRAFASSRVLFLVGPDNLDDSADELQMSLSRYASLPLGDPAKAGRYDEVQAAWETLISECRAAVGDFRNPRLSGL